MTEEEEYAERLTRQVQQLEEQQRRNNYAGYFSRPSWIPQPSWQSEPYPERETYRINGLLAVLEAGEAMKNIVDVEAVVKPEQLAIGDGKESQHEWKQRIYEEQKKA